MERGMISNVKMCVSKVSYCSCAEQLTHTIVRLRQREESSEDALAGDTAILEHQVVMPQTCGIESRVSTVQQDYITVYSQTARPSMPVPCSANTRLSYFSMLSCTTHVTPHFFRMGAYSCGVNARYPLLE